MTSNQTLYRASSRTYQLLDATKFGLKASKRLDRQILDHRIRSASERVEAQDSNDLDLADLEQKAARVVFRKYLRSRNLKYRDFTRADYRAYLKFMGSSVTLLKEAWQKRQSSVSSRHSLDSVRYFNAESQRVDASSDNRSGGLFEREEIKLHPGNTHPRYPKVLTSVRIKVHYRDGKPYIGQLFPKWEDGKIMGYQMVSKTVMWKDLTQWVLAIRWQPDEGKDPKGPLENGMLLQEQEYVNGKCQFMADREYMIRCFVRRWYNNGLEDAVDPNGIHYRWGRFTYKGHTFILTCPSTRSSRELLEKDRKAKPGIFRGLVQFRGLGRVGKYNVAGVLTGPSGKWFSQSYQDLVRFNWMAVSEPKINDRGYQEIKFVRDLVSLPEKIYRQLPDGQVQKFMGYRLTDYDLISLAVEAKSLGKQLPEEVAKKAWVQEWQDIQSKSLDDLIHWFRQQPWWSTEKSFRTVTDDRTNTAGVRYIKVEKFRKDLKLPDEGGVPGF